MKACKLYLNYAGYCLAKASHAVKGDPAKDIQFKSLFGLIQHPDKGWILFDTGYTRRFYNATQFYPNKLYALITKVSVEEKDEVKMQLKQAGIEADDIRYIIISHFHADHIGGLKDFKNARFYCSRKAWQQVQHVSNLMAFSKGILKSLIPENFNERVNFIEDAVIRIDDPIFGEYIDIFGDQSLLAYHVPGHAAGQIGVKLKTEKQTYLLAADACWDKRAFTKLDMPSPIVKLFFDSWNDYIQSIQKLKKYHESFPDHLIIPSHCFETYKTMVSSTIDMHVL